MDDQMARYIRHALLVAFCIWSATVRAFDIDIDWMRLTNSIVLDAPEQVVAAMGSRILLKEKDGDPELPHYIAVSEYDGLFYLNVFRDSRYQQRVHKIGPLPFFTRKDLVACNGERNYSDASSWVREFSAGPDLIGIVLEFDCKSLAAWQSNRYVLIDKQNAGEPFLAVGRSDKPEVIQLQTLKSLPEGHAERWLSLLNENPQLRQEMRWLNGGARFELMVAAEKSEESPLTQLRRLHTDAFRRKGDAAALEPLREFLVTHDYRQIGLDQSDIPRLLNDIAYWLTELGELARARPLLVEVLRREPQRMPARLNLADLDWRLHQADPRVALHLIRAKERYREYCSMRLARGFQVPDRVAQRLQLATLSREACGPHWPLIDAVEAGDASQVEALLAQGVPGEVVGDDGYSALLLALKKPDLTIAELLIAHGAHLHGLYRYRTIIDHSLYLDLADDPELKSPIRLRFILNAGASVDEVDFYGKTLLMYHSGKRADRHIVTELLRYPQNLDFTNDEGESALEQAISAGNFQVIDQLVSKGANPNVLYDGRLHCEGRLAQYNAVQYLAYALRPWQAKDLEYHRESLESFATLLAQVANLSQGQRCKMQGHSLLVEFLIRAQRADLIVLLRDSKTLMPALDPALGELAQKYLLQGSELERDNARKVLEAVQSLGVQIGNGNQSNLKKEA
ncbi:ankyrin repeat domain-containing protein [Pseudomonas sp. GCM10022188]|uniref:ankyrin repeat domain-containing protein n=1 Tax=Pseudomonas TaxID=286 RepID=UPI001E5BBC2D|nr:ankyrin repeat domain-containing protein [Pseudomonas oryzagri]MCC6075177.1 ankyrin repeat domain-containing protein [Pseudomonas oryzagri]